MSSPFMSRALRRIVLALLPVLAITGASGSAAAAQLPLIRTSSDNAVPTCVTPDRLMAFIRSRNGRLDPRFSDIARHYKAYGEAWRVRWDYAFYQMAIETNFLSYRQPNGRMGDVDPLQNNFAGIGTTGGGVPGDRFPDVKTGVHAQIQHLVVYSGERLAKPIAPRTQLKQDDILKASLALERPVRFSDLSRRWAVDPNYGKSIEWVASQYRGRFCRGGDRAEAAPPAGGAEQGALRSEPRPATRPVSTKAQVVGIPTAHPAVRTVWMRSSSAQPAAVGRAIPTPAQRPASAAMVPNAGSAAGRADTPDQRSSVPTSSDRATAAPRPHFDSRASPPAGLGASPSAVASCTISTASYGGAKSVLIKSTEGDSVRFTVLSVLEGFERSMTDSYVKSRAPGAEAIGEYATRDAALETARTLCPGAAG